MTENKISIITIEEEQKPKYYTERHRVYMRNYRAKHGSYNETQKKAIQKYRDRIRQEAKLYRELQEKGLITISTK